jgi:hypothetical protein
VAQLGERCVRNAEVEGSIPFGSSLRRSANAKRRLLQCSLIEKKPSKRVDVFLENLMRDTIEPKSIHTYLNSEDVEIYACDIDIQITEFPKLANCTWLYYFGFTVNFTFPDEWAHGGFQWSNINEFKYSRNKGVNWGGASDHTGCGGINNRPYTWKCNKWYRYRVMRVDNESEQSDNYRWLFIIKDYETGDEIEYGIVRTKSPYIVCRNTMVFTETGYGVRCDSPKVRVEWRNPIFTSISGQFSPKKIVANYNGTCVNPTNTNQDLLSNSPLCWFHETNATRTTLSNRVLWSK